MANSDSGDPRQAWQPLPLAEWQSTYETLHRWTQIVGKVKLELSPFLNELWEVALQLNPRGLTTGMVPSTTGVFEVGFDFLDHMLSIRTSEGAVRTLQLRERSLADFFPLAGLAHVTSWNRLPRSLQL